MAASRPWSEDLKALESLSLAPLNAQQMQQTQQRPKTMRTAMTVPIVDPTLEPPGLVGLKFCCLWGSANSKLKESISLQKASLSSASDVSFGSSEVRRLLLSASSGSWEIASVSLALTDVSPIRSSEEVLLFSAILSRVLLTASRITGEGFVSYVTEEQSTSMYSWHSLF